MKPNDKVKNYCSDCYKHTNHTVICVKEIEGTHEYQVSTFYGVVQCNGCDNISYRTEVKDYENIQYDYQNDDYLPHVSSEEFPQTLKYHIQNIELVLLPEKIRIMYNDAINAFAAKCYLLTAVAFRAIIEAVCIDKAIKVKDFEDLKPQIDKLFQNGFITENERARLHLIRFLGNDSIHAMAIPKERDLFVVLNMVEHLLMNLYIIDQQITGTLETLIKNFDEFRALVDEKVAALNDGETISLKGILGLSARRLSEKSSEYETQLIDLINNGTYKDLELFEVRPHQDKNFPDVQYYKVTLF